MSQNVQMGITGDLGGTNHPQMIDLPIYWTVGALNTFQITHSKSYETEIQKLENSSTIQGLCIP